MAFNLEKRTRIHDKYDGKCAYCGDPIAYKDMQIDHIIPKANFDSTISNEKYHNQIPKFLRHLKLGDLHHEDNLNPSCRVCNKYKDTMFLERFRTELSKQLFRAKQSNAPYRRALKYKQIVEKPTRIKFYFEKKRVYKFDGKVSLLQFDSEEERWFLDWVLMRRKFLISEKNVRELIKDINYWRSKSYELEQINSDLRKANRDISERFDNKVSELELNKKKKNNQPTKAQQSKNRKIDKLYKKNKPKKEIKRRGYKKRRR